VAITTQKPVEVATHHPSVLSLSSSDKSFPLSRSPSLLYNMISISRLGINVVCYLVQLLYSYSTVVSSFFGARSGINVVYWFAALLN